MKYFIAERCVQLDRPIGPLVVNLVCGGNSIFKIINIYSEPKKWILCHQLFGSVYFAFCNSELLFDNDMVAYRLLSNRKMPNVYINQQYYTPATQIGQEETALHASFTQVWSAARDAGATRRASHSKQASGSVDLYQL